MKKLIMYYIIISKSFCKSLNKIRTSKGSMVKL